MTRSLLRILQWLVIAGVVAALATLVLGRHHAPRTAPTVAEQSMPAPEAALPEPRTPLRASRSCEDGGYAEAASANAASLETLALAAFRRPEVGWAVYAPLIAHTIGVACDPQTPAFAFALARWQKSHGLPSDGRLDEATFNRLAQAWYAPRPHLGPVGDAACLGPPEASLAAAAPAESYGGKTILLRPDVLEAYRKMITAGAAADADDLLRLSQSSLRRGPLRDGGQLPERRTGAVLITPHRAGDGPVPWRGARFPSRLQRRPQSSLHVTHARLSLAGGAFGGLWLRQLSV